MRRKNIASVRRSEKRGTGLQFERGTNSVDKKWEEKEKKLNYEKLYAPAIEDTAWEPTGNAVLKLLISLRVSAALWGIISDCDEVYNYWEPLHRFLYGHGFQTWEYSPVYAIRSYFYIWLHYLPASFFAFALMQSKIVVFICMRCLLGTFTLAGEYLLFRAACDRININTGRFYAMFTLFSTGMFISCNAFLPSSFSMSMGLYMLAAYLREQWAIAIGLTAFSALVGWPFAAVLGLPIVVEMLILRPKSFKITFIVWSIIFGALIAGAMIYVDSYYFGKFVLAPLNIVKYNVLGGPGPELYGTEPLSYYIKNLLLNWNVTVPLALISLPASALVYSYMRSPGNARTILGFAISKDYWNRLTPIFLIYSSAVVWCAIFFSQPHKEERFLFPIYPHIALLAAVGFDALLKLSQKINVVVGKSLIIIPIVFMVLSFSRSYASYRNYGAHFEIYKGLTEQLMADDMDYTQRHNPIRICVGKEWHRFPSSFFLPEDVIDPHDRIRKVELRFLESDFRGLLPKQFPTGKLPEITRQIPTEMNDQNKEEKSRYVHLDTCDFLIDSDMQFSERQPNYREMDKLQPVSEMKFLVAEESHPMFRAFYVPFVTSKFTKMTTYTIYRRILPTVQTLK